MQLRTQPIAKKGKKATVRHEDCEREVPWDENIGTYACMCGQRSQDGKEWRHPIGKKVIDNMASMSFKKRSRKNGMARKGKKGEDTPSLEQPKP